MTRSREVGQVDGPKPLDKSITKELGRRIESAYASVLEETLPPDLLKLVKEIEKKL